MQLGGNPLDVAVVGSGIQPLTLAVAIDPASSTDVGGLEGSPDALDLSLHTLVVEDGGGVSPPEVHLPVVGMVGLDISRAELDRVIYAAENLRKTEVEDEDGGDEKPTKEPLTGQGEPEAGSVDVAEEA